MPRYIAPTPGTRIAVWIFPALTLWLGLGYLLADHRRLESAAFTAAKDVMPMRAWGVVFVTVAAIKVICLIRGAARGYVMAMCFGMGLYACWAFLFAVAFFTDSRTSPGAVAWPLFVIAAHVSTLSTLTRNRINEAT